MPPEQKYSPAEMLEFSRMPISLHPIEAGRIIKQAAERIAELESALEQVRRTDYVLNHMYCSCYICKALAGKNTGIQLGVY